VETLVAVEAFGMVRWSINHEQTAMVG